MTTRKDLLWIVADLVGNNEAEKSDKQRSNRRFDAADDTIDLIDKIIVWPYGIVNTSFNAGEIRSLVDGEVVDTETEH